MRPSTSLLYPTGFRESYLEGYLLRLTYTPLASFVLRTYGGLTRTESMVLGRMCRPLEGGLDALQRAALRLDLHTACGVQDRGPWDIPSVVHRGFDGSWDALAHQLVGTVHPEVLRDGERTIALVFSDLEPDPDARAGLPDVRVSFTGPEGALEVDTITVRFAPTHPTAPSRSFTANRHSPEADVAAFLARSALLAAGQLDSHLAGHVRCAALAEAMEESGLSGTPWGELLNPVLEEAGSVVRLGGRVIYGAHGVLPACLGVTAAAVEARMQRSARATDWTRAFRTRAHTPADTWPAARALFADAIAGPLRAITDRLPDTPALGACCDRLGVPRPRSARERFLFAAFVLTDAVFTHSWTHMMQFALGAHHRHASLCIDRAAAHADRTELGRFQEAALVDTERIGLQLVLANITCSMNDSMVGSTADCGLPAPLRAALLARGEAFAALGIPTQLIAGRVNV